LKGLAEPFKDREPADVIRRLVNSYSGGSRGGNPTSTQPNRAVGAVVEKPSSPVADRIPRERGGRFEINGQAIYADSVRDLGGQVLRYVSLAGQWDKLAALAPYKTSPRRYLIAKAPIHPNGNEFVSPVQYGDLYMETHKTYQTALSQLQKLLAKCDIQLDYLGT
jgi:hypothetical protein